MRMEGRTQPISTKLDTIALAPFSISRYPTPIAKLIDPSWANNVRKTCIAAEPSLTAFATSGRDEPFHPDFAAADNVCSDALTTFLATLARSVGGRWSSSTSSCSTSFDLLDAGRTADLTSGRVLDGAVIVRRGALVLEAAGAEEIRSAERSFASASAVVFALLLDAAGALGAARALGGALRLLGAGGGRGGMTLCGYGTPRTAE